MSAHEKSPFVAAAKKIKDDFHQQHPDAKQASTHSAKANAGGNVVMAEVEPAPMPAPSGLPLNTGLFDGEELEELFDVGMPQAAAAAAAAPANESEVDEELEEWDGPFL